MLVNWDAEEYGLIGSTEFVEEFAEILSKRAIVYLNSDPGVTGNLSFGIQATPMLYQITTAAARFISNPMQNDINAGRMTLYDNIIYHYPNSAGKIFWNQMIPAIGLPGGGTDHERFMDYIGIPVADFRYSGAGRAGEGDYTLYHSLYETIYLVDHFHDTRNFEVHRSIGQYWATLAFLLTDSPILPLNVTDFAMALQRIYLRELAREMQNFTDDPMLEESKKQFHNLIVTSQAFVIRCKEFDTEIMTLSSQIDCDGGNRALAKDINERLMYVERCFINPRGRPGATHMRHILYGQAEDNTYNSSTLAAVHKQISVYNKATTPAEQLAAGRELANQISIVHYSLQCALALLQKVI